MNVGDCMHKFDVRVSYGLLFILTFLNPYSYYTDFVRFWLSIVKRNWNLYTFNLVEQDFICRHLWSCLHHRKLIRISKFLVCVTVQAKTSFFMLCYKFCWNKAFIKRMKGQSCCFYQAERMSSWHTATVKTYLCLDFADLIKRMISDWVVFCSQIKSQYAGPLEAGYPNSGVTLLTAHGTS